VTKEKTFYAYVGPGMEKPVVAKSWDKVKKKADRQRKRTKRKILSSKLFLDFWGKK
jgi:hypothetical protein